MKSEDGATCDTLDMVPRPAFKDMIVSIARHKSSIGDSKFTFQFPLSDLENWSGVDGDKRRIRSSAFPQFNLMVERGLGISRTDTSVVWCLTESGQLAVINGYGSLSAAIVDHQNAGKSTIQLYVVKNSDMMNLPKHVPK